ncbi:MAG: outer membrane lipoprotein-sorting protein [Ignavibacteria bacterium]|nr:outer membrane lipoprotein-sorting protein [Ignavibacteria bacterium]
MFKWRVTFIATLVAVMATSASAITLQEVIAKNLEARGGVDKIKSFKSAKSTGTMSTQGGDLAFTRLMKGNTKFRMDMTIQGMSITQAYDGTVAWRINPMAGNKPEKVSDEELKDIAKEADWAGEFVDTETKGYQLELVGPEDLDGSSVYKVKITSRDGDVEYAYIDAITWLMVRKDQSMNMGGTPMSVETYYTDYREFGGIQVPMKIEIKYQGQSAMAMTIENIDTNADIPDELFKFPEQK